MSGVSKMLRRDALKNGLLISAYVLWLLFRAAATAFGLIMLWNAVFFNRWRMLTEFGPQEYALLIVFSIIVLASIVHAGESR